MLKLLKIVFLISFSKTKKALSIFWFNFSAEFFAKYFTNPHFLSKTAQNELL